MHQAARQAVDRAVRHFRLRPRTLDVLDVGGRDVNGNVRDLFWDASWTALDARSGPGVDIVADVTSWTPERTWDLVISTETLEHVHGWEAAVRTMVEATKPGGWLIITAATDPRLPHSALDGCALRPGEWYENVPPRALVNVLADALGLSRDRGLKLHVESADIPDHGGDVYAWAEKPK